MNIKPVSPRQCQPSFSYTSFRKHLIPRNRWNLNSIGHNTVLRLTFFCCRSLLCLQTKLMQSWVSQCCCWKWSHPNPLQVRTDSVLSTCSLRQVAKESWPLWLQNRSESFSSVLSGPFWPVFVVTSNPVVWISTYPTISHVTFVSTKYFSMSRSGCHTPSALLSLKQEEVVS